MLIGVDIGGTFTDIVAIHAGELRVLKLPTPREQEEGGPRGAGGPEGMVQFR